MQTDQVAYVAGLLEGEGCFSFNRDGKYPKIRMETTDLDVAERVRECLGCGTIREVKKRQAHWKQSYVYQISRQTEVELVLRAIHPWMGNRRKEKIDILLASFDL